MSLQDPVPGLRRLQRAAAAGRWLRQLARDSADEIEGLRSICGGYVAKRERRIMVVLSVLGGAVLALWVLGALGIIDFHVFIGRAGSLTAGRE